MRRLKVLFASLFLTTLMSFAAVPTVSAFDLFGDACDGNPNATVCDDADKNQTASNNSLFGPNGIVTVIVNILSIIIGVAAVIVIIVAGIQYMLSTGDPTKVNNAKNAILYAVVGLVIALVARTVVVFILSKL